MNTTYYENIWQKSLIHVTDEFALPPVDYKQVKPLLAHWGTSVYKQVRRKLRRLSM